MLFWAPNKFKEPWFYYFRLRGEFEGLNLAFTPPKTIISRCFHAKSKKLSPHVPHHHPSKPSFLFIPCCCSLDQKHFIDPLPAASLLLFRLSSTPSAHSFSSSWTCMSITFITNRSPHSSSAKEEPHPALKPSSSTVIVANCLSLQTDHQLHLLSCLSSSTTQSSSFLW